MSNHLYLSTGCLHGDMALPDGRTGHEYCQGDTGTAGAKVPAVCKFCGAACQCNCHRVPQAAGEAARLRAAVNGLLPVLLPCPGLPACPAEWFELPGHRHFMRAGRRVLVRRLLTGCWEALCPCCRERPVVAQVATWERAMLRASEHVREVHGDGA